MIVFDNYEREEREMVSKVTEREREHEDKGCGYDESLLLQHEEMTNFCFSFAPALHPPPTLSLSRVKKFLKNSTTAEYENFYINSTLNTQVGLHCCHTQTCANAHRQTVHTRTRTHTHVSMRLTQWWQFAMKFFPQLPAL